MYYPASHLLPHLGSKVPTPQACCCLKQATQSLLWREAHRPHVGVRGAGLPPWSDCSPAETPTGRLPEGLSSPLLPPGISFPVSWGLGWRPFSARCLILPLLLGPWGSVCPQGQIHAPPRLVLIHPPASPFGARCVPCAACAGSSDALSGNYLGCGLCP